MEFVSYVGPIVFIVPLLPIASIVTMDLGIITEDVKDAD